MTHHETTCLILLIWIMFILGKDKDHDSNQIIEESQGFGIQGFLFYIKPNFIWLEPKERREPNQIRNQISSIKSQSNQKLTEPKSWSNQELTSLTIRLDPIKPSPSQTESNSIWPNSNLNAQSN